MWDNKPTGENTEQKQTDKKKTKGGFRNSNSTEKY